MRCFVIIFVLISLENQLVLASKRHQINFELPILCSNSDSSTQVHLKEVDSNGDRIAIYIGSRSTPIVCETKKQSVTCTLPNRDIFEISSRNYIRKIKHDPEVPTSYIFLHEDEYVSDEWKCQQNID